jgi:hypothetical protein
MRSSSVRLSAEIGWPALAAASSPTQAWMSSVTSASFSRPKSPVLEHPERTARARSASAASVAGGGGVSRRQRVRSDIAKHRLAASHPSATAVVRRRMCLWLGSPGMLVGVTLDPDDGKDNDRGGFRRVTAEAHDASLVWKFNYVVHQPLSSAAGDREIFPDARNSASP